MKLFLFTIFINTSAGFKGMSLNSFFHSFFQRQKLGLTKDLKRSNLRDEFEKSQNIVTQTHVKSDIF